MNRKARLNYIHALSTQVEHKKMYKAKKQWVVAGISFLVATGLGAVGSHLTTHADTTQAKAQTTLPINKGSQSSASVEPQAKAIHNALVNKKAKSNVKPQVNSSNTQVSSAKVSATPASNKVSGSQVSSSNAKSSVSSNVATSGDSMNTLKLGNSSEQNKGWNYVQSGIKPSSNDSKVSSTNQIISSKKNKPMMLNVGAAPTTSNGATVYPDGTVKGTWGTAPWTLKGNTLNIGSDTGAQTNMETNVWPQYFTANVKNYQGVDIINVNNVKAPIDSSHLFTANSWIEINSNNAIVKNQARNLKVKVINLNHFNTSDTTNMSNMFDSGSLQEINGLNNINTHNVKTMYEMFASCGAIHSLDLSNFDTQSLQGLDFNNAINGHGNSQDTADGWMMPGNECTHIKIGKNTVLDGAAGMSNKYPWLNEQTGDIVTGLPWEHNKNNKTVNEAGDWFNVNHAVAHNNWDKNDKSSALWLQDQHSNLFISHGWITKNINQGYGINWPSIKHVYISNNVTFKDGSSLGRFNDDLSNIIQDYQSTTANKNDMDNISQHTPNNWSDTSVISNDANIINTANSNIANDLINPTDSDADSANNDASMASSAYNNANVENLVASATNKFSGEMSSADKTISNDNTWIAHHNNSLTSGDLNSISDGQHTIMLPSGIKNMPNNDSYFYGFVNQGTADGKTYQFAVDTNPSNQDVFFRRYDSVSKNWSNWTSDTNAEQKANATINSDITSLTSGSGTSNKSGFISSVASYYASSIATSYASNAVNWVTNYGSNASNAGSWYAAHSTSINTIINSMNNADTAYTDAIKAFNSLSSIASNSNSVTSLSNEIHEASGIQDQINSISAEIGSTSNSSTLASDYSALSNDVTQLGSAISGANNNGGINFEIANLQSQTAFTFRLHNENTGANEPFTVAKSYITQNYNPIKGTKNQYDITNLLSAYVQSKGQSVNGHYIVTLNDDDTASLSVNNQVGMNKLAMPRYALSAIHLLGVNNNKASDDTVEVYDNPVTYQGTITLNFKNANGTIKSDTLNFNTTGSNLVASDSVNLLNCLSDSNLKGISNPSTLLSKKLISGFDTTGFTFTNATASDSYNNNGKSKTVSMPKSDTTGIHAYNFIIQPSAAVNQNNNSNIHNYHIVLNYSAKPVTEIINYVYGKHSEGSTQASAADDDTPSYWTTSSGVSAGWQLSSSSNSFTYTENGSVNVNVVPQQASAYIEYEDVNHNNSKVVEASVTGNSYAAVKTGASGNNNFNTTSISASASYYGVPSGYSLSGNSASNYYYGNSNSANPIIIKVAGNSKKPTNSIKPSNNPSDANNNKSNQSMNENTSGDKGLLVTIKAVDYDSNGKSHINTKYATESGNVGDTFTIKASDYQTYGYLIDKTKDKDSDVTLKMGANGLTENGNLLQPITFKYYAIPYNSKTTHKYDPSNPIYPQPITIDYVGEKDGKSQVVLPDKDVITGATGDTGNITNYKGIDYEKISDMANMAKQFSVLKGYTYGNNSSLNPNFTITTKPQTITINLASKTASDINKTKGHYNKAIPSDKPTAPSSDNTPNSSDVKNNISDAAKHGYVTVIIAEHDVNNVTKYSYQTVDLNKATTGYGTQIDPTSYTPTGYQVDSSKYENDAIQNVYTDANGDADPEKIQFDYDINQNEIEPIDIVYKNQYGDLLNISDGKSTKTGENVSDEPSDKYTQKFTQSDLAKLGTVGDYVNLTKVQPITAPLGHHFNLQNGKDIYATDTTTGKSVDLNNIQLQQMPASGAGVLKFALALPEAPTPNSNSAKPSSSAAQVSMSSDQLASLAKDIGSNITIKPNISETDEVIDNSALTSLASEVATNNQEISNLANKPTSAESINYDYFNNLVNNGVSKLTNAINKDFKSNIKHVHAKPVTTKKTVGKRTRTYSYLKWLRVVKPLKLYNNNHEAVRTIKPRHRITLNAKAAYKVNNHIVFKVSYRNHNYFIKANDKTIKNAYLPATKKLVGKRVRVLYNVYANRRKASGRVKTLHKGYSARIKNIVRIGSHNVTRIQLANGLWISANMNYVKVL